MPDSVADLRREYTLAGLLEQDVDPDPFVQFQRWFDAARAAEVPEPNGMTLATADAQGRPAARTVLLKGFDVRGFVFYTNYESRKAQDLAANPQAALLFWWEPLQRQVRIEGRVARIAEAESDAYFGSRPRGSQLGAWASPQSQVIAARPVLEQRLAEAEAAYGTQPVPRPPHWGGFRVVPTALEFWQGRRSRLHDRLLYTRTADGHWRIERLAP